MHEDAQFTGQINIKHT